jgi:TolB protein
VPKVDFTIDVNTGVMMPLPRTIIRSLGKLGDRLRSLGKLGDSSRRVPPRWYAASPDGSLLAYAGIGDEGSLQIFTAGIDGAGVRQVTHDPRGATTPAWSPDGTMIAYTGYGTGKVSNFFVFDVATGKSRQVTDGVRDVWGSQFTPDGLSLVFTQGASCCPGLRTVPVAGGKSTILVRPEYGLRDLREGSLSPDGSLVTFLGAGSTGGERCGPCRLVANVDGSNRRVISHGCWDTNPAGTWSPDGGRIVCSSGGYYPVVNVVDIATGDVSRIAEGAGAIWLDRHTLVVEVR